MFVSLLPIRAQVLVVYQTTIRYYDYILKNKKYLFFFFQSLTKNIQSLLNKDKNNIDEYEI